MEEPQVILTGIKPTGKPHLGNYVGMMRPALNMTRDHANARFLYFIADYHALTTLHDAEQFAELNRVVAASWLALGLDPEQVLFYRQSDITEVFELTWLLSCVTAKGLMNRAHAYKAAVQENVESGAADVDAGINMGLYNYPILMAADILLFDTDLVPVGEDQVQHVEIARDIAGSFNHEFGEALNLPQHVVQEGAGTVPGIDGRKMSKSYGNIIPLFAPSHELRDLVFKIQTDSTPRNAPKDPGTSHIFALYREFATPEKTEEMRELYLSGAVGWADAKQALYELLDDLLAEPRARYNELIANPERIDDILQQGAEKARPLAEKTLGRVREAVGKR